MGALRNFILVVLSVYLTSLVLVVIIDGPPSEWRFLSIPEQAGKVVIVTGANAGIGFHFSRHMVARGATVIMACRDPIKCKTAQEAIAKEYPKNSDNVFAFDLDLARQTSVIKFVDAFTKKFNRLDILLNNAGIMAVKHNLTEDGFEQHIAVNHLGHFTLTGKLLPLLQSTSAAPNPRTGALEPSRIITVSSLVERYSIIHNFLDYDDLHWQHRPYSPDGAYFASKIANIQFMKELHSRLSKKKPEVLSVGAHPGYSFTEIQQKMEAPENVVNAVVSVTSLFGQSAEMGAAPLLYAATAKEVKGGSYYGPGQALGLWGWPKEAWLNPVNLVEQNQVKLWQLSETLTKTKFLD